MIRASSLAPLEKARGFGMTQFGDSSQALTSLLLQCQRFPRYEVSFLRI